MNKTWITFLVGTFLILKAEVQTPVEKISATIISIANGDFTIEAIPQYESVENLPGLAFFYQLPKSKLADSEYQRSIQGQYSKEPIFIDQFDLDRLASKIVRYRKSAFVSSIPENPNQQQDYKISKSDIAETNYGHKAMVFFAEGSVGGVTLVEMHVVYASINGFLLLTFTDEEKTFKEHLLDATNFMMSVKVLNPAKSRFDELTYPVIAVLSLFGIWSIAMIFKRRKLTEFEEKYSFTDFKSHYPKPLSHDHDINSLSPQSISDDDEDDNGLLDYQDSGLESNEPPLINKRVLHLANQKPKSIPVEDDDQESEPPATLSDAS